MVDGRWDGGRIAELERRIESHEQTVAAKDFWLRERAVLR